MIFPRNHIAIFLFGLCTQIIASPLDNAKFSILDTTIGLLYLPSLMNSNGIDTLAVGCRNFLASRLEETASSYHDLQVYVISQSLDRRKSIGENSTNFVVQAEVQILLRHETEDDDGVSENILHTQILRHLKEDWVELVAILQTLDRSFFEPLSYIELQSEITDLTNIEPDQTDEIVTSEELPIKFIVIFLGLGLGVMASSMILLVSMCYPKRVKEGSSFETEVLSSISEGSPLDVDVTLQSSSPKQSTQEEAASITLSEIYLMEESRTSENAQSAYSRDKVSRTKSNSNTDTLSFLRAQKCNAEGKLLHRLSGILKGSNTEMEDHRCERERTTISMPPAVSAHSIDTIPYQESIHLENTQNTEKISVDTISEGAVDEYPQLKLHGKQQGDVEIPPHDPSSNINQSTREIPEKPSNGNDVNQNDLTLKMADTEDSCQITLPTGIDPCSSGNNPFTITVSNLIESVVPTKQSSSPSRYHSRKTDDLAPKTTEETNPGSPVVNTDESNDLSRNRAVSARRKQMKDRIANVAARERALMSRLLPSFNSNSRDTGVIQRVQNKATVQRTCTESAANDAKTAALVSGIENTPSVEQSLARNIRGGKKVCQYEKGSDQTRSAHNNPLGHRAIYSLEHSTSKPEAISRKSSSMPLLYNLDQSKTSRYPRNDAAIPTCSKKVVADPLLYNPKQAQLSPARRNDASSPASVPEAPKDTRREISSQCRMETASPASVPGPLASSRRQVSDPLLYDPKRTEASRQRRKVMSNQSDEGISLHDSMEAVAEKKLPVLLVKSQKLENRSYLHLSTPHKQTGAERDTKHVALQESGTNASCHSGVPRREKPSQQNSANAQNNIDHDKSSQSKRLTKMKDIGAHMNSTEEMDLLQRHSRKRSNEKKQCRGKLPRETFLYHKGNSQNLRRSVGTSQDPFSSQHAREASSARNDPSVVKRSPIQPYYLYPGTNHDTKREEKVPTPSRVPKHRRMIGVAHEQKNMPEMRGEQDSLVFVSSDPSQTSAAKNNTTPPLHRRDFEKSPTRPLDNFKKKIDASQGVGALVSRRGHNQVTSTNADQNRKDCLKTIPKSRKSVMRGHSPKFPMNKRRNESSTMMKIEKKQQREDANTKVSLKQQLGNPLHCFIVHPNDFASATTSTTTAYDSQSTHNMPIRVLVHTNGHDGCSVSTFAQESSLFHAPQAEVFSIAESSTATQHQLSTGNSSRISCQREPHNFAYPAGPEADDFGSIANSIPPSTPRFNGKR